MCMVRRSARRSTGQRPARQCGRRPPSGGKKSGRRAGRRHTATAILGTSSRAAWTGATGEYAGYMCARPARTTLSTSSRCVMRAPQPRRVGRQRRRRRHARTASAQSGMVPAYSAQRPGRKPLSERANSSATGAVPSPMPAARMGSPVWRRRGGKVLRSIGLARAARHLHWKAATYTLRRLCSLKEARPRPFCGPPMSLSRPETTGDDRRRPASGDKKQKIASPSFERRRIGLRAT